MKMSSGLKLLCLRIEILIRRWVAVLKLNFNTVHLFRILFNLLYMIFVLLIMRFHEKNLHNHLCTFLLLQF